MLRNLKQHVEANGSPPWGLGSPHDFLGNDRSPLSGGFFAENGGSWETPYTDFFLSWYSSRLLSHGDCILSLATSTFEDTGIAVSGRVPLVHSWHRTHSRPAELTAGFYNAAGRDSYSNVAKIFSRNGCGMILPGMDLTDEHQPAESRSSPQLLLEEIMSSCRAHRVTLSGQNSLPSGVSGGFDRIKKKVLDANSLVDTFTYQRMGASFFAPDHFSLFVQFVRCLKRPVRRSDDLASKEGRDDESVLGSCRLQTA